jgi:hypothetical protein
MRIYSISAPADFAPSKALFKSMSLLLLKRGLADIPTTFMQIKLSAAGPKSKGKLRQKSPPRRRMNCSAYMSLYPQDYFGKRHDNNTGFGKVLWQSNLFSAEAVPARPVFASKPLSTS